MAGLTGVLWSNHSEERERTAITSPLRQGWNLEEAISEGYVIVSQGGDE